MSDDPTPKERAENALKAAGFVECSVVTSLSASAEWHREGGPFVDVANMWDLYKEPSEATFELCISDFAEHLPAYLNAKVLLQACEAVAAAVDALERCTYCNAGNHSLSYGFCGKHSQLMFDAVELTLRAVAKARGEQP